MGRIVCKFGGSSVADAGQFKKVKAIIESNPKRTIVVPSAPGKRFKDDPKITDLLYLCYEMAQQKVNFDNIFQKIFDRYVEIETELGLSGVMEEHLNKLREELKHKVTRDFVASRGEYLNGLLMAAYLEADFIDPAEYVVITPSGGVDEKTYHILGECFKDETKRYVMPGFYGRDQFGHIKTFSRGGSDISGSIAARAAKAELYENWTDVSGLLMVDPRIVKNPANMDQLTYREIRELSYMGASVFHDEAILPVREAQIPINIRNTNDPSAPGTLITPTFQESQYKIAGIAGKTNFKMITLEKTLMNREVGFGYKVLGVLFSHRISFEHAPTSIDSMSIVLDENQLKDENHLALVLDEIRRAVNPDKITVEDNLAMIAIVGEEFIQTTGLANIGIAALTKENINIRIINMGASEMNVIIGVSNDDYKRAVKCLYDAYLTA